MERNLVETPRGFKDKDQEHINTQDSLNLTASSRILTVQIL